MAGRGEARYRIVLDTGDFKTALEVAARQFQEFGTTLLKGFVSFQVGAKAAEVLSEAIKGIPEAVIGAVEHVANMSHEFEILSAKTGLTTTALQELKFAAAISGGSIDDMAGLVNKMQKNLVAGNAAFGAMGLSINKLRSEAPETAFFEIAEKIRMMKNPTDQAAAALAVFSKAGAIALPMIKAGLAGAADEAHRLGTVLAEEDVAASSALASETRVMGLVWEGFQNQLAATIASSPELLGALKSMTEQIASGTRFVREHEGAIKALGKAFAETFSEENWGGLRTIVSFLDNQVRPAIQRILDPLGVLDKQIGEIVTRMKLADAIAQLRREMGLDIQFGSGHGPAPPAGGPPGFDPKMKAAIDALVAEMEGAGKKTLILQAALREVGGAAALTEKQVKQYGQQLLEASLDGAKLNAASQSVVTAFIQLREEARATEDAVKEQEKAFGLVGTRLIDSDFRIYETIKAWDDYGGAANMSTAATAEFIRKLENELPRASQAGVAAIYALGEATRKAQLGNLAYVFDPQKMGQQDLGLGRNLLSASPGKKTFDWFAGTPTWLDSAVHKTVDWERELQNVANIVNAMGDSFSKVLATMVAGIASIGTGFKSLDLHDPNKKDAFGKSGFSLTGGAGISGLLKNIGAGMEIAGAALSIGKAIYSALVKPEYMKVMDDIGKKWGVQISEALAKQIESTETKLHVSRAMAELLNLSSIMKESGKDSGSFANQIGDLMNAVALHAVPAKEGIAELGKVFLDLKASAEAGSIASEKAMLTMIARAKELGIVIPEMAAAILASLKNVAKELVTFFAGMAFTESGGGGFTAKLRAKLQDDLKHGRITQAEYDKQKQEAQAGGTPSTWSPAQFGANATILGATFGGLAGQEGVVKAAQDLHDAFEQLIKGMPKGGALPGELKNMAMIIDLIDNSPNFKRAAEAAEAGAEAMKGLAAAGALSQKTTEAFDQSALTLYQQAYDAAIAGGYSPEEAKLAAEQANLPLLAQLQHAQEMGATLSPQAQAILKQAQEDGTLPLKSVADQQLGVLREIRDRLPKSGMASGGFVPPTPTGTLHLLGEGNEGEFVIPKSKMPITTSLGGGGIIHVTIPVTVPLEGNVVGSVIVDAVINAFNSNGPIVSAARRAGGV